MLTDLRSVKSEETRWEENFLKEVFPHNPLSRTLNGPKRSFGQMRQHMKEKKGFPLPKRLGKPFLLS